MPRSNKPSVWIEQRRAASSYITFRVQSERDGDRFPALNCGPSRKLATTIKAKLELMLWEREHVLERLIAELRDNKLSRQAFAADLLNYLTTAAMPARYLKPADTITVGQWAAEYLTVCREQNRASTVREFDERAVNAFAAFASAERLLRAVDQDLVRDWKKHLQDRGGMTRKKKPMPLGPTTVRMRLSHAGAGFAWARKRGWIEKNPFDLVERPPSNKHERVLSGAELTLIYSEILPPEDHGWFTTLLCTGLRREELVGLSKTQVLPSNDPGELWRLQFTAAQTKNKKAKLVELRPEAQVAIAQAMTNAPGEQIFDGLSLSRIQHAFERIQARLGRVTPHTLKHTFCTRFMEATGDMESLMKITGNSRRSLELHYLHLARARSRIVLEVDFGFSPPTLPLNADGARPAGTRAKRIYQQITT